MGNGSSSEEIRGLGSQNFLSKVSVKSSSKSDIDAFLTEGRVDNVQIAYVTKKQVGNTFFFFFAVVASVCVFSPQRITQKLQPIPVPPRRCVATVLLSSCRGSSVRASVARAVKCRSGTSRVARLLS